MSERLRYFPYALCVIALFTSIGIKNVTAEPYPGFTLVAASSTINLYDMDKKIVKTWKTASTIQTAAYLLPDGSVLAPISGGTQCPYRGNGAHPNGRFQRFDWDGKLLWDYYYCTSTYVGAYDIEPMPNGNVLVLVHCSTDGSNKPGKIVEIQPNGSTGGSAVWECNITSKVSVSGYLNSISYNPALDQIAITIQESGRTVAVIDHKTGNLVSKYAITSGRVHGCCWSMDTYLGTNIKIPEADATKMRLGNITFVANDLAKVYEINPATATATLVKSINYSFGSNQGGTQRLPNGNTLVTKGYSSTIDEIDDTGAKIWTLTAAGSAMRVYRYGMNYPGVSKLTGIGISAGTMKYAMNKALKISSSRHTGFVTIRFANNEQQATVRVFTLNGTELFSALTAESQISITAKTFASGTYIIHVERPDGDIRSLFNVVN